MPTLMKLATVTALATILSAQADPPGGGGGTPLTCQLEIAKVCQSSVAAHPVPQSESECSGYKLYYAKTRKRKVPPGPEEIISYHSVDAGWNEASEHAIGSATDTPCEDATYF